MAAAVQDSPGVLPFEEAYNIVKSNERAHFHLVYRTLLVKPDYLYQFPTNESYAILHNLALHGALGLFNQIIAIPNLRFILLTETLQKPRKNVLNIAKENKDKSPDHAGLYKRIDRLVQMDKFVEHAKMNEIDECKKMLKTDKDLANEKPPYRRYYLIHHLAYANNRPAFDELRKVCEFDAKLLTTGDHKTAAQVAFEQNHVAFAQYLEGLYPEMCAIREEQQKKKPRETPKSKPVQSTDKVEKEIISAGGTNMLDCFTCPLTRELFEDPVILSDGFTYERAAIQKWLDMGNRRSPMTNVELTSLTLVPNNVIKQALQELADKQKK